MSCRSLFLLLPFVLMVIGVSVLRITAYNPPFDIFKLFFFVFLSVIVLFFLLRFTASNFPFDIFKIFFFVFLSVSSNLSLCLFFRYCIVYTSFPNVRFGIFKPFSVIRSEYFVYIFSNKIIKVSNAHGAMLDLIMNAKTCVIISSRHHMSR